MADDMANRYQVMEELGSESEFLTPNTLHMESAD
jgi:hypothetical protein